MDYVVLTLLITFLLLAIWNLSATIQYDNNMQRMQDYLSECERQNEEDAKEDLIKYLKEVEDYDKLMKDKTN